MTLYSLLYSLHVLAAMLWVGGMFFAWMVLRPSAAAILQPPERLKLWVTVFRRFFLWVWLAVLVLPMSGMGIWHMRFAGFVGAPGYVHIMAGLYLMMLAVFLRIALQLFPRLEQAVNSEDWPNGGNILGRIRHLVGVNLSLGLLTVALAAARPYF
ncbi:CopD family protein [Azomonas macrocytogenes]|uniref:Putative membrane protein n=1 Tax=Azomonas macrocytogenes TaxID=69962 RepID=A0A839T0K1_AZOMA|nr:CopD family protein [Azomonas macrocytogenes]MBB3101944.1 putative membrane protein [Azomonas macrocytogenes]